MKIGKKILILLIVAVLLAAAIMASMFLTEYTKTKSEAGEPVTVNIAEGSSGRDFAEALKDAGLIRFKSAFLLKLRNSEYAGKLPSGRFELHKGMCIDDIINTLAAGGEQRPTVQFTIPEGFSVEQIAARLEKQGLFTAEEFLNEVNNGEFDYDFLSSIPRNDNINYRLQGFLFPDTYSVYADATPHEVIDVMLKEFKSRYEKLANNSGRGIYEIVTIAAMIEREAKLDSERPLIAGVIENRLAINMRLQIDATVIYAISGGMYDVERVLYRDLEVNSPYNVYANYGLPVGPICNPGEKSLEAAMNPASHEYLYYHTDEVKKDGSHIFTTNFEDHKATMN